MATCNPSELVQAAACFLARTSVEREAIMLALLCRILQAANPMATCDVNTLMEEAKCFLCLKADQRSAVQTQLLCEILQGGGGGTCIICLSDDESPTDPATCDCSIAYNMIGQFWFWNSLTASWLQISV